MFGCGEVVVVLGGGGEEERGENKTELLGQRFRIDKHVCLFFPLKKNSDPAFRLLDSRNKRKQSAEFRNESNKLCRAAAV